MGCEVTRDDEGRVMMISCSRGSSQDTTCEFCGSSRGVLLCDFPLVEKGGTCDARMCKSDSRRISDELDLCPNHAEKADLLFVDVPANTGNVKA